MISLDVKTETELAELPEDEGRKGGRISHSGLPRARSASRTTECYVTGDGDVVEFGSAQALDLRATTFLEIPKGRLSAAKPGSRGRAGYACPALA